jgi:SAM-dependent methyltransferase
VDAPGAAADAAPPDPAVPQDFSTDEIVARYYDLEHDVLVADAALYRELARAHGGPVLELGCGTGRLVLALSRAGFPVVGVDSSHAMLARAEARLRAAADARGAWRLVRADVRDLSLPDRFGTVLAPLDFLGYFHTLDDQLAVLAAVARHLATGGRLVVDVTFPTQSFFAEPERVAVHQWTQRGPAGEETTKWWVREIDPARQLQRLTALYDVRGADGILRRWVHRLDLRYYHRYELELLLARGGFAVEALHGGYALDDLTAESPRLIAVAVVVGQA